MTACFAEPSLMKQYRKPTENPQKTQNRHKSPSPTSVEAKEIKEDDMPASSFARFMHSIFFCE